MHPYKSENRSGISLYNSITTPELIEIFDKGL